MKKIMLLVLFCLVGVSGAQLMAPNNFQTQGIPFFTNGYAQALFTNATIATTVLDSITRKVAYKFYPSDTTSIDSISVRLDAFLSPVANLKMSIQTDNSDAPSGTIMGDSTNAFAGPAADGSTGMQGLKTRTGSFVINTPYWLVLEVSAATTLNRTNYWGFMKMFGTAAPGGFEKIRQYNGADWTTVAAQLNPILHTFKLRDGRYQGVNYATQARSAVNDIYNANKQGISFVVNCRTVIPSIYAMVSKQTTPDTLIITIYKNDVSFLIQKVPSTSVSTVAAKFAFSTPLIANKDTTYSIIFSQNGTTSSANYDLYTCAIDSNEVNAILPQNYWFVYGTSATPSELTRTRSFIPMCTPMVWDVGVAFTQPATGTTLTSNDSLFAKRIYQATVLKRTTSRVDGKDTLYKADNSTVLAVVPRYEDGTTIKRGRAQWLASDTSTLPFSTWLYRSYSAVWDSSMTTKADSTYKVVDSTGATTILTKDSLTTNSLIRRRGY
jgi:hypothetical protein